MSVTSDRIIAPAWSQPVKRVGASKTRNNKSKMADSRRLINTQIGVSRLLHHRFAPNLVCLCQYVKFSWPSEGPKITLLVKFEMTAARHIEFGLSAICRSPIKIERQICTTLLMIPLRPFCPRCSFPCMFPFTLQSAMGQIPQNVFRVSFWCAIDCGKASDFYALYRPRVRVLAGHLRQATYIRLVIWYRPRRWSLWLRK